MEETRPGEYLPVYENERGTYLFNSRDLCMIEYLPELMDAGIDSFKIEGRMKNALYVASVARAYRCAIDACMEDEAAYRIRLDWYREQVSKCTYRKFSTGFYFGKPGADAHLYDSNAYEGGAVYLGIVESLDGRGLARIEQKNKFYAGDRIEIMKPDGTDVCARVERILDEDGQEMASAPHPKQCLYLKLSALAESGDILRQPAEKSGQGV